MVCFPLVGKSEVSKVVPHKKKMLLLSEITSFDGEVLVAKAKLGRDNPFSDGKGTPCYVSFELIAQAVSAFSYISTSDGEAEPEIGFILRLSSFVVNRSYFEEGKEYLVHAKATCDLGHGLYEFEGKVTDDDVTIAEGAMMVARGSKDIIERMVGRG